MLAFASHCASTTVMSHRMKIRITLITFLIHSIVFSQNLTFEGEKIEFISIKSESAIEKGNGIVIGDSDSLLITESNKSWKIAHFEKKSYTYEYHEDTLIENSKTLKFYHRKIKYRLLFKLLKEIENSKYPITCKDFEHQKRPFNVRKKDVKSLFALHESFQIHQISEKYANSKKKLIKEDLKEMNKQELIDTFLKSSYNPDQILVVSGFDVSVSIVIITASSEYEIHSNIHEDYLIWTKMIRNSNDWHLRITNPNINLTLKKLLPNSFKNKDIWKFNRIIPDYVKWYYEVWRKDLN